MKKYLKDYFKLLIFVKPYRGYLLLAAVCMGMSTLFEGVTFTSMGAILDRIGTNKKIVVPGSLPPFLASFIEKLNAIQPLDFLSIITIWLPILFLLKGMVEFIQDYVMNVVAEGTVKQVRNSLYEKFQELSMNFYARQRLGELMSRVTNDVTIITNAISYALKDLILESMKVCFFGAGALVLGFRISWILPFVVFVIFPAIMYPVVKIGKRIKKLTVAIQQKMADLNSHMVETIQGIHIVKAFCRECYEIERFKDINQQYYRFNLKSIKRIIMLPPLTEFTGVLGIILITRIVAPQFSSERLSFGVFAIFIAFLTNMIRPMKKLSGVHAINQRALAASVRIYEILEEEPQIKEKPQGLSLDSFSKSIIFEDVWFGYDENDDYVLRGINLEVKKGETVALVGYSGVGKTTLVSLISRFYDPQKGRILIDGIDIREITLKSLRSLVSIVSQDIVLFNATVRDNIAYGKLEAKDSKVIEAAKKAHAYDFTMNMPAGFNTIVGDRGFRLSGGEKQRLAIARAILKDAPILILDEATSNLDAASEQLIQEALYTLMEGRTTFVIAHRLSTVQKADRIVVLDKGSIVEAGAHEHLLASPTLYKKLYDLQFNV